MTVQHRAVPLTVVTASLVLLMLSSFLALFATIGTQAPAAACPPEVTPSGEGTAAGITLDAEQMQVAAQIVVAVRGFRSTSDKPRAAVIALASAQQESRIRNLTYGDRDSLGAFQQRPSQGWGTPAQVRDVAYATRSFLRRLVLISGWETMRVTDVAAQVQRPAAQYRGLYERWVPLATALTHQLWTVGENGDAARQPLGETCPVDLFRDGGGTGVPRSCSARGGAAEVGLTPDALRVMRCALTVFGPHVVGGVGSRPNASDHPSGRAVDIMIPGWDTSAGNREGWQVAQWAQVNAARLGVTYVIFDARIWSVARASEGWRAYSHPIGSSNPTLDHLDHVHVSVEGYAA